MKNLYKWAGLVLAAMMMSVSFIACDDDEEDEGTDSGTSTSSILSVSPTSISMASEGGTSTLTIDSNTSWTISVADDASWVSLSVTSGSDVASVTVTVAENDATSSRSTSLTVATIDGKVSASVTVSQASADGDDADGDDSDDEPTGEGESGDENITVSPANLSFGAAGGSMSTTITTEDSWNIYSLDAGDDSWVSLSATKGTGSAEITVTVSENTSVYSRSLSYVVACGDSQASLNISQQAAEGTTSSSVTVEFDDEIKVGAAGSGYYDDSDEDYAGEPVLTFCVYVEGSNETPTVTSDNSNFEVVYVSSSSPSERTGTEYWYGLIVGETTSESATTCTLTVKVEDYVGYIKVIQASVSGSYAAEGEEIIFVSNGDFLTLMGETKISNLYTTYGSDPITLYSDSEGAYNINLTINSEENCEWYYFKLSSNPSYYFRFYEGGEFTISCSNEDVTFTKIEFLNTEGEMSLSLDSSVGTVSVGSSEDIEKKTFYSLVWTGTSKEVTFTATSQTNVRAMRFTFTGLE